MTHTHDFDVFNFGFEDVLVAETKRCTQNHCDATQTTQYEVDLTSFTKNRNAVSERQASQIWTHICNAYGTTFNIAVERPGKNKLEIETAELGDIIFSYTDQSKINSVTIEINNNTVSFDVDFHRTLSVEE